MDYSFTTAGDYIDFVDSDGFEFDIRETPETDTNDEDLERIERLFRESIQFV